MEGRQYGQWSSEDMVRAITSMENGDMGLNETAKFFNVPKATLSRHLKSQNKIANGGTNFCIILFLSEQLLVIFVIIFSICVFAAIKFIFVHIST